MSVAASTPGRYDVDRADLAALLDGEPPYRIEQLWHGLYHGLRDPDEITTLPAQLRARLGTELPPSLAPAAETTSRDGDTVKWLWDLRDGRRIETVLMHYEHRSTACVSSQAGCAMACGFCATGQAGFERHLTVGEIVEQVVRAAQRARPRRLSNVVFMGMGEPLANFEATWGAIQRIHGALGLSARRITVSTVGVVPGIDRLTEAGLPVSLAVSLHAATDELRDELVPLNRRYPIAELVAACERYRAATGRRVSFEWALIDGVNDRPSDAAALAKLAQRIGAHVNLIPLNPTPGYPVGATPAAGVERMRLDLQRRGVNVTVRQNRGTDIEAACGQLRAAHEVGTEVSPPRPLQPRVADQPDAVPH